MQEPNGVGQMKRRELASIARPTEVLRYRFIDLVETINFDELLPKAIPGEAQ